MFFDLESKDGSITELCIKAGCRFTIEQVKDLRDDIKLGDTVLVSGVVDHGAASVVLPSSITITARWRDDHPGEHFVPRCSQLSTHHKPHNAPAEPRTALEHTAQVSRGIAQTAREITPAMNTATSQSSQVSPPKGLLCLHYLRTHILRARTPHNTTKTAEGNTDVQVCKFHINGGCQKGDECPHLHVDLLAAPRVRKDWIAERCDQFSNSISLSACDHALAASNFSHISLLLISTMCGFLSCVGHYIIVPRKSPMCSHCMTGSCPSHYQQCM